MTEIKICGIRKEEEIAILNQVPVSYAGFVIFQKSKRYVTPLQAKELFEKLNPNIKKVAVTVSPDEKLLEEIERAGFDVLQVHGELEADVIKKCRLPVWRAINLNDRVELEIESLQNIIGLEAVLVDAKDYGSGKTFDWRIAEEKSYRSFRENLKKRNLKFILAGGLTPDNVAEGIRIFTPDAVDVSSGVEGTDGKEKEKILAFVKETGKETGK